MGADGEQLATVEQSPMQSVSLNVGGVEIKNCPLQLCRQANNRTVKNRATWAILVFCHSCKAGASTSATNVMSRTANFRNRW